MLKGVFFILAVFFFTLFFNIDISPNKLYKSLTIDEENIFPSETRATQYLELKPFSSPQQKIQKEQETESQTFPEKTSIQSKVREEFTLFKVISNSLVPSYILQGNYVINALSPIKDTTAYLYPDEWETVGDIYLKDTVHNIWTRLQLDQQMRREMWNTQEPAQMKYTPKKKILWLNNEEFLIIIGYAHGTVSTGGDCVKVNKLTGRAEMIYPAYQKVNQEVTDIEISEGRLILRINVMDSTGLCIDHEVIVADLDHLESLSGQEMVSESSITSKK